MKKNEYVHQQRHHRLSNYKYNKLLEIKSILGEWKQTSEKAERKNQYYPDCT